MLCVKNAWLLDDAEIEAYARKSGMDVETLVECVNHARKNSLVFKKRHDNRKRLLDESWLRLKTIERKLVREENETRRDLLKKSLNRKRSLMESKRENLKKTRMLVPNRIVANILDIPKGTVDAALFSLRKRWLGQRSDRSKNNSRQLGAPLLSKRA
jgi:hypothetical protein